MTRSSGCSIDLQDNGSLAFRSDGTYGVSSSVSGTSKFAYTAECLSSFSMTCDEMGASLASTSATDAGVSGSCCAASSGDCTCTEAISSLSTIEDGTCTTSRSTLVTTPPDPSSDPSTAAFCVQGNRLTIRFSETGSSGAYGLITATK